MSPIFLEQDHWTSTGFLIFAAVGLFRPLISAKLALISVRRLGPTLTSTLTSTTPLFAAILGVLLFGEDLTVSLIAGTVAIFLGTALPTIQSGDGVRTWPVWVLMFPLGAAGLRSFAHAMIGMGLAFSPEPLVAGLAAYSVSFLMALLVQAACQGELASVD